MSSENVGDFLVKRLHEWGIRRIFGYPGDGINGIMGALERHCDLIEFVQSRHEELAAFMACAHAKFTGQVGVCLATSGPGAIHLLNGLYDAQKDNIPVVAIVGQQARTAMGADYQQEVDLLALFKDVAHHYVHMCHAPAQMRTLVDQAVRIAVSERVVTCIIVPNDLQTLAMEQPPRAHGATLSGVGYSRPRVIPFEADLRRAAEVLNEGKRVAMLVGAGALGAEQEVTQVANMLGAGVAKALLGKAVLPDDLPWVTGPIGLLGSRPSWDMMQDCDTLLMVGTNFPYTEFLPPEGQARAVQIDVKPRHLGLRYPIDVNLHGDTRSTLEALLPLLRPKSDDNWRLEIGQGVEDWWATLEERAMQSAHPINPQRVFWELSPRLPDDCILTCDSGSSASWFARDLKIRSGMMASLSGGLATMGPGVPYAFAAKLAYPERAVIACVGDGAMQMNGLNGLITIARLWSGWSDPRLIVLVLNNRDLNMVSWEERVMEGDPKFPDSQDLPQFNYAEFAGQLGLKGIRMEKPEDVGPGWDQAFASDRPVVVDALVDPDVPPMPPHISSAQAIAYGKALLKGDPDAWGIVVASLKDMSAGTIAKIKSIVK
jgi:pyruvate dehydrogenase (quinone)